MTSCTHSDAALLFSEGLGFLLPQVNVVNLTSWNATEVASDQCQPR